MGEYGELEHIKHHEKFVRSLNVDGCNFGRLLRQEADMFKRNMHSKIEDSKTVSQLSIDMVRKSKDDIGGLKIMVHDAINCTHASKKIVEEMQERAEKIKKDFEDMSKYLPWKLLGVVLGGNLLFVGAGIVLVIIKMKSGGQ